jgi:phospholipid/cholesterol/gamma-HCH transport system permease protein
MPTDASGMPRISYSKTSEETLLIHFEGNWTIEQKIPSIGEVQSRIEQAPNVRSILFDVEGLELWDSAMLTFLMKLEEYSTSRHIEMIKAGLPDGVQKLLALAAAVPETRGARRKAEKVSIFAHIGKETLNFGSSVVEMSAFIGEAFVASLHFLSGRARFRRSDLILLIQECGAQALPIVSLISVLVGLILAFIGAVQLVLFGAQIYVANLVGIAMVRVMGAVMTGVIMAGRTGAAFAAQLGTMTVNEEIDALETMGISPMEFLVVPRMFALFIMMPLLCVYADAMGVLGGFIVGVFMLGINPAEYMNQTRMAVTMTDFWIGLFHSAVFGILVALSGCLRGMQCGRSASAVGAAATSAVVTGIVSIVVATAIITVICNILGI